MFFEQGRIYRHPKTLDVDMLIHDIIYQDEYVATMQVYWVNKALTFMYFPIDFVKVYNKEEWTQR